MRSDTQKDRNSIVRYATPAPALDSVFYLTALRRNRGMTADLILEINAYHADAAACVVCDGNLIAAAERLKPIVCAKVLLIAQRSEHGL
jgi:hypothetical protein